MRTIFFFSFKIFEDFIIMFAARRYVNITSVLSKIAFDMICTEADDHLQQSKSPHQKIQEKIPEVTAPEAWLLRGMSSRRLPTRRNTTNLGYFHIMYFPRDIDELILINESAQWDTKVDRLVPLLIPSV